MMCAGSVSLPTENQGRSEKLDKGQMAFRFLSVQAEKRVTLTPVGISQAKASPSLRNRTPDHHLFSTTVDGREIHFAPPKKPRFLMIPLQIPTTGFQ